MAGINRPLNDENSRHALVLAHVFDARHAPGFFRAITENDSAWECWLSLGEGGRMDAVRAWLDVLDEREDDSDDDLGDIHTRLLAVIGAQREAFEDVLLIIAKTGCKPAVQALITMRELERKAKAGAH